MSIGTWPGTVSGCNCKEIKRQCSRACHSRILSQPKQSYSTWNGV